MQKLEKTVTSQALRWMRKLQYKPNSELSRLCRAESAPDITSFAHVFPLSSTSRCGPHQQPGRKAADAPPGWLPRGPAGPDLRCVQHVNWPPHPQLNNVAKLKRKRVIRASLLVSLFRVMLSFEAACDINKKREKESERKHQRTSRNKQKLKHTQMNKRTNKQNVVK